MASRLTPLSKFLITVVVLGAVGLAVYKNKDKLLALAPEAEHARSNVPPLAKLPDDPGPAVEETGGRQVIPSHTQALAPGPAGFARTGGSPSIPAGM